MVKHLSIPDHPAEIFYEKSGIFEGSLITDIFVVKKNLVCENDKFSQRIIETSFDA
ncbi:MAG: hypothetical protein QG577_1768 [Thermodesulfobacteriota bacterium]|nr:hypothetical protein [Thermodesulfobacteriota bacterium]